MHRKEHLSHTKHGGPTCKTGRIGAALQGEHITLKYSEFATSAAQCARCRSSSLFAFLERQAAKELDAWIPEAPDAWIAADAALIAKRRAAA